MTYFVIITREYSRIETNSQTKVRIDCSVFLIIVNISNKQHKSGPKAFVVATRRLATSMPTRPIFGEVYRTKQATKR